jgi:alpha-tubulin suppressor-like RCC1 family protein
MTTAKLLCGALGLAAAFLISDLAHGREWPTEVSTKNRHTCALVPGGKVYCWGANESGQLGVGVPNPSHDYPDPVSGVITFSSVSVGGSHTCGTDTNNKVYCWGANSVGQLGTDSGGTGSSTPVAVAGGLTFGSLTTGGNHSCARATNGFTYCWGANNLGQLGDGTNMPFAAAPIPIRGKLNLSVVEVGGAHGCHTWAGGLLFCWGLNSYGEVGNETRTIQRIPVTVAVPVGGGTYKSFALGYGHTCAVSYADQVYCWGNNATGQLGDGTHTMRLGPQLVTGGLTFTSVTAGHAHTCGLRNDGSAYCWGDNADGQLGDGTTTTERTTPTPVGGGVTFTQLSAGEKHTCALNTSGAAYCWGRNTDAQLGDGTTSSKHSPTPVGGGLVFVSIVSGGSFTCGLTAVGVTYCWGKNDSGQLGDGSYSGRPSPAPLATAVAFTSISAGYGHACGLTSSGDAYCWGYNGLGSLGDGTQTNQPRPVKVLGGVRFSTIRAAYAHTCGITTDHGQYCWGANTGGQIGDGTTLSKRLTPVSVAAGIAYYEALSAGDSHTCGITAGYMLCWGSNSSGQLGDGSMTDRRSPVQVSGSKWGSVASGGAHTCGLEKMTELMYCWGNNAFGQVGDGTTVQRLTPVIVFGKINFVYLSAGATHTCGARNGTGVYCWGQNGSGRLGNGTSNDSHTPVAAFFAGGSSMRSIASGVEHTCAVNWNGFAICWGANSSGQLGIGPFSGPSYLPVDVQW